MEVIKFKRNPYVKYNGNLLVISFDEFSYSITGYENIRKKDTDGNLIEQNLEPIPLTEEWLLKAQAIKLGDGDIKGATFWKLMDIVFYEINGEYIIPVGHNLSGHPKCLITFNKVHELQSIFDITPRKINGKNKLLD